MQGLERSVRFYVLVGRVDLQIGRWSCDWSAEFYVWKTDWSNHLEKGGGWTGVLSFMYGGPSVSHVLAKGSLKP